MQSYREYPVRCKSCNDQIACHAKLYEDLTSINNNPEDTFDQLNVHNWCCRAAYVNPTIVTFDMEDRALIEGYNYVKDMAPSFNSQLKKRRVAVVEAEETAEEANKLFVSPVEAPAEFKIPTQLGIPTINVDPTIPPMYASAGIGKSLILNGRTYLAR